MATKVETIDSKQVKKQAKLAKKINKIVEKIDRQVTQLLKISQGLQIMRDKLSTKPATKAA